MIKNAKAVIVETSGNEAAHESYLSVLERGLTPVFLESAQEALEAYQQGDVAVLVSDLRLAEMDGLVLARKVRRFDPDAVIILTAAIERKADLLAALRLGVFDFFVKPFGAREFADSLERAVAYRARSTQPRAADEVAAPEANELNTEELHANEEELSRLRLALEAKEQSFAELEKLLQDKEARCERTMEDVDVLHPLRHRKHPLAGTARSCKLEKMHWRSVRLARLSEKPSSNTAKTHFLIRDSSFRSLRLNSNIVQRGWESPPQPLR